MATSADPAIACSQGLAVIRIFIENTAPEAEAPVIAAGIDAGEGAVRASARGIPGICVHSCNHLLAGDTVDAVEVFVDAVEVFVAAM